MYAWKKAFAKAPQLLAAPVVDAMLVVPGSPITQRTGSTPIAFRQWWTFMPRPPTQLAIVVPCYNEQEVLPETCDRLLSLLRRLLDVEKIAVESRIYFVDDGSRDATWRLISDFVMAGLPVVGIRLGRNRGHQNALLAGLFSAAGDAIITVDADLQDDLGAIETMLDHFHDRCDIVYGVRNRREPDGRFKRYSAECFYRVMAALGVETNTTTPIIGC